MDLALPFLILLLVAFLLGGIAAFTRSSSYRKWSFRSLAAVSVLNLIQAFAICWTFRDGLGPDSIASTGSEAFRRALSEFWFPLLLIGGPVLFAVTVSRFRSHGKTA